MKRNRKNLDSTKKGFIELTDKFLDSTPDVQRKILWLISELIKNLNDADLKNFWSAYLEILITNSQTEPITDLEEMTQAREDFTDFFNSVEKHQSETVSALEEITKKDTADLEAMLKSDV